MPWLLDSAHGSRVKVVPFASIFILPGPRSFGLLAGRPLTGEIAG